MKATLMSFILFFAATPMAHPAEPANRLAKETSPYLLQHAHNPVDWYPWGDEAFTRAKQEDKPIFLSVGYSTCHWCHVMAHESFEDAEVAKVMNEHFVCIKVDREELPDVDEQYMLATQLMTQRGGWPNSVVLTPDGRPWYAGTYYPKDRFIPLLKELAKAWKGQRPQVEEQANQLSAAIRQVATRGGTGPAPVLSRRVVDHALREFRGGYDTRNGGFGTRPKFPPHGALALMLDSQTRTNDLEQLGIITHTLDAMSRGGIYDHIGGGFHRYSTDARWFTPHFEKMLYDNAQLIRAYALAYALTKEEDYRRVVAETFEWIAREMTDPAGGFYSALDADSEGEEGKFYVWTLKEVERILGDADARAFAQTYNITHEGTYHEEATGHPTGANIPYLSGPLDQPLAASRAKLLDVRNRRVHPHLDDKVLTGWNGLMIAALAVAGRELGEPRYTKAAERAADFVLKNLRAPEGRLLRTWRKGEAKLPAYLDDYAFLIDGLLELHATTRDARFLDAAKSLTETMITDFHDPGQGGFFSTSESHGVLIVRTKEVGSGGNIPSGNGVAADALLRLAVATGDTRYADLAAGTLRHLGPLMVSQPHGAESLLLALSRYVAAADEQPALKLAERLAPTRTTDADAVAGQSPVIVEAYASQLEVAPGGRLRVALVVKVDPGYHIYGHTLDPETKLVPTSVGLEPSSHLRLGETKWPLPQRTRDPILKTDLLTHDGRFTIFVSVEVPADAPEGDAPLRLRFQAQPCDETACYPPVDYALALPIRVARDAKPSEPRHPEVFTD